MGTKNPPSFRRGLGGGHRKSHAPKSPLPSLPLQMNKNRLQNTLKILENLTIPKTQNLVTIPIDHRRPKLITHHSLHVLTTIQLNDKLRPETRKIDDEPINRHLPTKFITIQPPSPKMLPNQPLRIRRRLAHRLSTKILLTSLEVHTYTIHPINKSNQPKWQSPKNPPSSSSWPAKGHTTIPPSFRRGLGGGHAKFPSSSSRPAEGQTTIPPSFRRGLGGGHAKIPLKTWEHRPAIYSITAIKPTQQTGEPNVHPHGPSKGQR